MEIWHDLQLLVNGTLERSLNGFLLFALASTFLGFLIFILDYGFCYAFDRNSILGLDYKHKKILFLLIIYVIGAGGVGFLGVIVDALNLNIQGAATAGFGWPIVFSNMAHATESKVPEQKQEAE